MTLSNNPLNKSKNQNNETCNPAEQTRRADSNSHSPTEQMQNAKSANNNNNNQTEHNTSSLHSESSISMNNNAPKETPPKIVDREIKDISIGNPLFPSLRIGAYKTSNGGSEEEHYIIYKGALGEHPIEEPVLLRIDSACFTGGIFGDKRCECHQQLVEAMRRLEEHDGYGLIIHHLGHEGKANGAVEKLRAYKDGMFPVEVDKRNFAESVAILKDLQISRVTLMTNNPEKEAFLAQNGIEVVGSVGVVINDPNLAAFYDFKARHLGHRLPKIEKEAG